jgi:hypothetical protein
MDKKGIVREKEELMRDYIELSDVAKLLEKKLRHLRSKKFGNKRVLAILERDLTRIKDKTGGYKGKMAHLTYLQVHSGRRK